MERWYDSVCVCLCVCVYVSACGSVLTGDVSMSSCSQIRPAWPRSLLSTNSPSTAWRFRSLFGMPMSALTLSSLSSLSLSIYLSSWVCYVYTSKWIDCLYLWLELVQLKRTVLVERVYLYELQGLDPFRNGTQCVYGSAAAFHLKPAGVSLSLFISLSFSTTHKR